MIDHFLQFFHSLDYYTKNQPENKQILKKVIILSPGSLTRYNVNKLTKNAVSYRMSR